MIDSARGQPYASFTAGDYVELMSSGAFADLRIELVRGELRKMLPSDWRYGEYNANLSAMLISAYRAIGARVAGDAIVVLGEDTVRAGDIVVARPGFAAKRPDAGDVILVVEIADTSLVSDLAHKSMDYALAGIPHCWVVDVNGACVHVLGDPAVDGYKHREVVRFGEPLPVPGTDRTITID